MATTEKAKDRGRRRGLDAVATVGRELRLTRRSLDLSLNDVACAVDLSMSSLSRIERGLKPNVSLVVLTQLCEVVGLELSTKVYPGGGALRDARHAALLGRFRARLSTGLRWRNEVPLPIPGDRRAWDGAISGEGWFYGVEAELHPVDGQALLRRLSLKLRDGGADGVILLLPDTRMTRGFRRTFADLLATDFPTSGRRAMELRAAGGRPKGSAVVVL